VSVADNELGWRLALAKLAELVEGRSCLADRGGNR
jgi:hypothetical protein